VRLPCCSPIRLRLMAARSSDEAVDQPLVKAGRWLLQVSSEQIRQLETEEQQKLKTGLRMVLEVIARMKAD
jgi:hypothetical protein